MSQGKNCIVNSASLLIEKVAIDKYATRASFTPEGNLMPQRVICHGCNYVLYEGPALRPPDEIIHVHDGKCPKCAKKLSLLPMNVEVKPSR